MTCKTPNQSSHQKFEIWIVWSVTIAFFLQKGQKGEQEQRHQTYMSTYKLAYNCFISIIVLMLLLKVKNSNCTDCLFQYHSVKATLKHLTSTFK